MTRLVDLLRSGWSFYFRFPNTHTDAFQQESVYLGPLLQTLVFAFFAALIGVFHSGLGESDSAGLVILLALVSLSVLTGFFHDDGLADTADGFGPSAFSDPSEKKKIIQKAMKDSRLGTYGVSVLIIFWMARYSGAMGNELSFLDWCLVIFASRACGLVSVTLLLDRNEQKEIAGTGLSEESLANHVLSSVPKRRRNYWAISQVLFLLVAGLVVGDLSWPVKFCLLVALNSILLGCVMRRNGQICGDTIGASICFTEFILIMTF